MRTTGAQPTNATASAGSTESGFAVGTMERFGSMESRMPGGPGDRVARHSSPSRDSAARSQPPSAFLGTARTRKESCGLGRGISVVFSRYPEG